MKKTFYISGMHCVSCEVLLEKEIQKLTNVQKVKASYKKEILNVEGDDISTQKIIQAVKKCGYNISQEKEKKSAALKLKTKDFFQIGIIFVIVLLFAYFFAKIEIVRFFPSLDQNISFVVSFLLGIIASVSTCLALTGGIVMSFASKYDIQKNTLFFRALPQIYFHIGRIVGFGILGGLLGLIGQSIGYSLSLTGYLTIVVGLIMFYIGLHILNFVPSITRFGFYLPKKLSSNICYLQKKENPLIPATIGALTFFLPCGFTQSMQLAAVASGSFWTGAFIMMFFAFGTLPVLFAVGLGSSYAQKSNFGLLKKIIGVLIVFFAFYSFNSGLVLTGFTSPLDYFRLDQKTEAAEVKENIQVIKMNADYTFKPNEFKIKKGIPVRWEINGINITGCNNEVIIPRLGISSGKLKKGLNVVEFTPTETGILPFSCWMGMINGRFIVTDNEESANLQSDVLRTEIAEFVQQSCNGDCGQSTCEATRGGSCGCGQ